VDNSSVLLPPNYNKYELPVRLWKKGKEVTAFKLLIDVALFIRRVLDIDTKNEVYMRFIRMMHKYLCYNEFWLDLDFGHGRGAGLDWWEDLLPPGKDELYWSKYKYDVQKQIPWRSISWANMETRYFHRFFLISFFKDCDETKSIFFVSRWNGQIRQRVSERQISPTYIYSRKRLVYPFCKVRCYYTYLPLLPMEMLTFVKCNEGERWNFVARWSSTVILQTFKLVHIL